MTGGFQANYPGLLVLDCLGRVRCVKAEPHAVASRALTSGHGQRGGSYQRGRGRTRAAIGTGRTAVRRAISGHNPGNAGSLTALADRLPQVRSYTSPCSTFKLQYGINRWATRRDTEAPAGQAWPKSAAAPCGCCLPCPLRKVEVPLSNELDTPTSCRQAALAPTGR